ncbi:hypothetical protein GWK47_054884 [Chionoecetes opilio]|uniref:Uncharacterized protein n=1 Tax=Chionoecetes opilio TaxID=41210 RepID=A0A8J4Y004_CHIOP|nr:hypothetical protein GWK47_054884 [Chionoecetes opilio]
MESPPHPSASEDPAMGPHMHQHLGATHVNDCAISPGAAARAAERRKTRALHGPGNCDTVSSPSQWRQPAVLGQRSPKSLLNWDARITGTAGEKRETYWIRQADQPRNSAWNARRHHGTSPKKPRPSGNPFEKNSELSANLTSCLQQKGLVTIRSFAPAVAEAFAGAEEGRPVSFSSDVFCFPRERRCLRLP